MNTVKRRRWLWIGGSSALLVLLTVAILFPVESNPLGRDLDRLAEEFGISRADGPDQYTTRYAPETVSYERRQELSVRFNAILQQYGVSHCRRLKPTSDIGYTLCWPSSPPTMAVQLSYSNHRLTQVMYREEKHSLLDRLKQMVRRLKGGP